MNSRKFTMLVAFATAFFSQPATADVAERTEGMPVALGAAWDPFAPTRSFVASGCFTPVPAPTITPGASVEFAESFIETYSDFQRITRLGLRAAGSVRAGVGRLSAAAEYSRLRSSTDASRTVTWALSGRKTFQPNLSGAIRLSADGQNRLDAAQAGSDFNPFLDFCGRTFITAEVRESQISVVYSVTLSNSSYTNQVRAAISAAYNSPTATGSASVDLFERLRSVDSRAEIRWRAFQTGISGSAGTPSVQDIVGTQPGDLTAVRKVIKEALSPVVYANAPIVRFNHQSTSETLGLGTDDRLLDFPIFLRRISRLEAARNLIDLELVELDSYAALARNGSLTLAEGSVARIAAETERLEDQDLLLVSDIRKCQRAAEPSSCVAPSELSFLDRTSLVTGGFAQQQGWNARGRGGYDNHRERIVASADFWPVVRFNNVPLIREAYFERTNSENKSLPGGEKAAQIGNSLSRSDIETAANDVNMLEAFLKLTHSYEAYCWRGAWGTSCTPWAGNSKQHVDTVIGREAGFDYTLVITDISGVRHSFPLGNASKGLINVY